jgi:leucyl aminopeptidase
MVSGRGLRPGDILTAANGKTVEVNNTDAEGRLTLADALWFAQEKAGVTAVVDIATLTGACIIALGGEVAGLFTPSDDMAASLSAASKASGEKVRQGLAAYQRVHGTTVVSVIDVTDDSATANGVT